MYIQVYTQVYTGVHWCTCRRRLITLLYIYRCRVISMLNIQVQAANIVVNIYRCRVIPMLYIQVQAANTAQTKMHLVVCTRYLLPK